MADNESRTPLSFQPEEFPVIRFIADALRAGNSNVTISDLPGFTSARRDQFAAYLRRYETYGWIELYGNSTRLIKPLTLILQAADNIESPPLRNRPQEAWNWFLNRPWSVPIVALIVGVPIIVGWLQAAQWMFRLFSGE